MIMFAEAVIWVIMLLSLFLVLTFLSLIRDIREDLRLDKEIQKEELKRMKEENVK